MSEMEISFAEKLNALEGPMLELPQIECPVENIFGPGLYIRQVTIPAGTVVIGHSQNFEQLNILLKGRMTLFGDNGEKVEAVAPMTFVGKPGRKVAQVHEEVIFMNVYATTETDIEKLEAHYVTKTQAFLSAKAKLELGGE